MPVDALGSTEVLLKLLAIYQGGNGKRADPQQIWHQVAAQGSLQQPLYASPASDKPSPEFLADLEALRKWGLVRRLDDGRLEVTPLGHIASHGRRVPRALVTLQERMSSLP